MANEAPRSIAATDHDHEADHVVGFDRTGCRLLGPPSPAGLFSLSAIREGKLYRATHPNDFEGYCRDRWGMKKAYANHLIRSMDTVKSLTPETATIVATESQARELSRVEPARREEVVQKAVEATGGKLTAA